MNVSELLGRPLKDDEVIDLLEMWDMEVIYEFDRTHENLPDAYWAANKEQGIQLRFDEHQVLKTIFIYQKEVDGFSPADPSFTGVSPFPSIEAVRAHTKEKEIATTEGKAEWLGEPREWIRLEFSDSTIHYEFRNRELGLITLQKSEQVASRNLDQPVS